MKIHIKFKQIIIFIIFVSPLAAFAAGAQDRPRLLVLTDIGGDPDDQQSLVRLLVHSNEFAIEGLIASASGTPGELKDRVTQPQLIRAMIDAYDRVFPVLSKHAEGFPAATVLREVVKAGNPNRGVGSIGEGHDTEGSRWIVACADRADPRPLNIVIWGGQTDLAQALWRVRKDRGEAGSREFEARMRVFDIDDQDRIHDWLFEEFPDVFYVLGKAAPKADKREGAYRGMYLGGDRSLTSLAWLDKHVRKDHGPLGAAYPPKTSTAPNPNGALKEGDTPSWFFFFPNGLGDPGHPEWGGWGGRYVHERGGLYRDAKDAVGDVIDARTTVWRWRPAFQNEFAARMDWCVTDDLRRANHPPVAVLNGDRTRGALLLSMKPGGSLTLSANGSSDPDGDAVSTRWSLYREAGENAEHAILSGDSGATIQVSIPELSARATVHVILAVVDAGTPPLTRYRRAVIDVRP